MRHLFLQRQAECRSGSGADRGKDPGTGRRSESTIEGIDF